MSRNAEITPLVRKVTADATGRAKLHFTITNSGSAPVTLGLSLLLGDGLHSADVAFEGGERITLASMETAQVQAQLTLPPGTRAGRYLLRLAAAAAGEAPAKSASIEITLDANLPERVAPKQPRTSLWQRLRHWLGAPWRWLRGLLRWFAARGFGLLIGTGATDTLVVDARMAKRGLALFLAVFVVLMLRATALPAVSSNANCTTEACVEKSLYFKMFFTKRTSDPSQSQQRRAKNAARSPCGLL
jgi:hypothetical protein